MELLNKPDKGEENKKPNYTSKKPLYMGSWHKYKEDVNKKFEEINSKVNKNNRIVSYTFAVYFIVIILCCISILTK